MCILLSFLDDEEDEPSSDINNMSARLAEVVILKARAFNVLCYFFSQTTFLSQKMTQLTTSFPNDRDFLDRELQAFLAALLDGFPGVEPLRLPTGRFLFIILPGKMKNSS